MSIYLMYYEFVLYTFIVSYIWERTTYTKKLTPNCK